MLQHQELPGPGAKVGGGGRDNFDVRSVLRSNQRGLKERCAQAPQLMRDDKGRAGGRSAHALLFVTQPPGRREK